jgi:hypothetical protein
MRLLKVERGMLVAELRRMHGRRQHVYAGLGWLAGWGT